VSGSRQYLLGLMVVAGLGAALIAVVSPVQRDGVTAGVLLALALQAPLGWWTLRRIGRPNFQLVWSLGILIRLAALGLTGLVLVPAFHWEMGPTLGTLVAVMMTLLLVEAASAMREHTWGNR
jgi:hypothetical protein